MRKYKLNVSMRVAAAALVLTAISATSPAADHGVDSVMASDPPLPPILTVVRFQPRLKELWIEALARPEVGIRFQALEAVDVAVSAGMPNAKDFLPLVLKLMRDPAQKPEIRLAAARVVVDSNAKDDAPDLLAMDRAGDLETALQIDPALARWKTGGAADLWLERLKDHEASRQLTKSAMRCLAAMGDMAAVAPLTTLLFDAARNSGLHLVAAQAIATLGSNDARSLATRLLQSKDVENRILAAAVLPAKAESTEMLLKLALDPEAAVAAIAVQKMMTISPDALYRIVAKLATHSDAPLRHSAVEVLRRHAAAGDVTSLVKLLNDSSPNVRAAAREALIQLDENETLRTAVRNAASACLNEKDHWRSTQQAALILGSVHEVAAKARCVELLRDPSPEVRLGAIVALRRLNVPETFPAQLQRAEELAGEYQQRIKDRGKPPAAEEVAMMDQEIAQLNQNLGVEKYAPANAYLLKFVPKNAPLGFLPREAAIWSLGLLHDGVWDAGLAGQFAGCIADEDPRIPEDPEAKVMSAISLAHMRDRRALPGLKKGIQDGGRVEEACEWGMAYVEGKPYAGPKPVETVMGDWFLEPE